MCLVCIAMTAFLFGRLAVNPNQRGVWFAAIAGLIAAILFAIQFHWSSGAAQ